MKTNQKVFSQAVVVEIDMKVKTEEFEGPLGVLLNLIIKNKLDITRISLVKIVDQFIEYSNTRRPDIKISAEFVRIASILLYLKTLALSNIKVLDEDMEVETEKLIQQLEIMKQYRQLKDMLKQKRDLRKKMFSKLIKKNISRYVQYSTEDLLRCAVKYFINIQRDRKFQLKRDEASISLKIDEIKRILQVRNFFNFSEIVFSEPILQQITSFMAILETTKSEITKLEQHKNFDDILVIKR
ncbi:MAG: segregation/condensation protein A [Brevinematales bacterium]|nr:segregation/condensation protein A [Brevinematales bacterium]